MLRPNFVRTSRRTSALALALASVCYLQAHAAQPVPSSASPAAHKPVKQANAATPDAAKPPAATRAADTPDATAAPGFSSFAQRYGPAVVHVIARGSDDQSIPPEQEAIDTDDPFFAFFKHATKPPAQDGGGDGDGRNAPRVMSGAGSGFIVTPDGLVLTTAHIVGNAEEVRVRLADKREFKAQVVAVDPQSDVAVLQIDAHSLPFIELGKTSAVRVGERFLSIGSPDSYENTATTGIVSATSRTLADGGVFPFMQTDVAANPDNSGGPLFDGAGKVIGIDVQLYTGADGYEGLTFAIPIEAANKFRAQLDAARNGTPANTGATAAAAGDPVHTFGMQVEDVSPGVAAALGLPRASGALVDSVDAGSAGAAAGVKAGDVIVQVGAKPVEHPATLASELASVPPATHTTIKLFRNRRLTLAGFANTARVANAAEAAQPAATPAPDAADATDTTDATDAVNTAPPAEVRKVKTAMTGADDVGGVAPATQTSAATRRAPDRLGLVTHALTQDEKTTTGLPLGLMVEASTGPAAHAGVRPGDVVLSFDGTLLETEDQAATLEASATKSVSVLIQRKSARSFVNLKPR